MRPKQMVGWVSLIGGLFCFYLVNNTPPIYNNRSFLAPVWFYDLCQALVFVWLVTSAVAKFFLTKEEAPRWVVVLALILWGMMVFGALVLVGTGEAKFHWYQDLAGLVLLFGWPIVDIYALLTLEPLFNNDSVDLERSPDNWR